MNHIVLDELLPRDVVEAIRKAWPADEAAAEAEARKIAELLSAPNAPEALRALQMIIAGLVGPNPDANAWAVGMSDEGMSFRKRSRIKRAPGVPSPSRALEDDLPYFDNLRAKVPAGMVSRFVEEIWERIRIVIGCTLVGKLRSMVVGKAALGAGWPIMVAVNDHCNAATRNRLHASGDRDDLIKALAVAVEEVVQAWERANEAQSIDDDKNKGWYKELPPGVDPQAYFSGPERAVIAYRTSVANLLGVNPSSLSFPVDARSDAATFGAVGNPMLAGTAASTDVLLEDAGHQWSGASADRLRGMMPLLCTRSQDLMTAAAVRGAERMLGRGRRARDGGEHPRDHIDREVEEWIRAGLPPPPSVPVEMAAAFEELACLWFLEGWFDTRALVRWRKLGFFPGDRPTGCPSPSEAYDAYRGPGV